MFIDESSISGTWQSFERSICRLLLYKGFYGTRIVGSSGDRGADIIAHFGENKRYLFQIKHWRRPVGTRDVEKTIRALRDYNADVPVIVSSSGFDKHASRQRNEMLARQIQLQLWDFPYICELAKTIPANDYPPGVEEMHRLRPYQDRAVNALLELWQGHESDGRKGLIVMATGLGKTRTIAEFVRRSTYSRPKLKLLAAAHTNELVYQLEQAFLPFQRASQKSIVWNGYESQTTETIKQADCVFACINTVAHFVNQGGELPEFDVVFVDECHHVGESGMYMDVLSEINAGQRGGAFLVGVSATPWRPDDYDLARLFGDALISIDLVAGLKNGFLSNIDYRIYTTNFNWQKIGTPQKKIGKLSPKGINRTLFISEWDDGVIDEIEHIWKNQAKPRALVFCGSIQHAQLMRDKLNARQFCRAEAIFSAGRRGERMMIYQRNRVISDFQIGRVQVLCCVDILNEGIDVPDVNIVVFQRVTHSRRIFIQQLGQGLRLAPGKEKVIALDFVSDVRRFAAGLTLKDSFTGTATTVGRVSHLRINHKISFHKYGEEDNTTEGFLREWLEDIAKIEEADEDAAVLRYPRFLHPNSGVWT